MKPLQCQVHARAPKPDWSLCALYRISNAIDFSRDPETIFSQLLQTIMHIADVRRGMLLLQEKNGAGLHIKARAQVEEREVAQICRKGAQLLAEHPADNGPLLLLKPQDTAPDEPFFQPPLFLYFETRLCHRGLLYLNAANAEDAFPKAFVPFYKALADQMGLIVDNLHLYDQLHRENIQLRRQLHQGGLFADIRGESPPIQHLKKMLVKVVQSPSPVMLIGESGTGKEVVARAIHGEGPRSRRAFVAENCAALPENLLESELFGHARGAYTGANQEKPGLFEVADGGTLFLDEIADTSSAVQAKLLRALEAGEIRRLGDTRARRIDVRIITATSRNLLQEIERGRFRAELYYRLSVLPVQLPPLRERPGDIPLLAKHFLRHYSDMADKNLPGFDKDVLQALASYTWPGNVRQLRNEVERMAALADSDTPIDISLLSDPLRDQSIASLDTPLGEALPDAMQRIKKTLIINALEETQGNRTRAATTLGISRPNLQKTMKRLGIE